MSMDDQKLQHNFDLKIIKKDMPKHILRTLQKAWVCNQQLNLAKM